MAYDYSLLAGKIKSVFGSQHLFAKAMDVSEHSISKKMNGKAYWKQEEIEKACEILSIERDELHSYFFALRVQ